MKMVLPNYNDCITNVACSVLKYFGQNYTHKTIKDIDEVLEKEQPKNVVVLLYDGMGYNLINRILKEKSFLRTNMKRSISSVCPATTTASTIAMQSGLNPCEHGWLGWDTYIPGFNKIVTLFPNTLKGEDTKAADYHVATKYFPFKNVSDVINKDKKYLSREVSPFGNVPYKNLRDMNKKIIDLCNQSGKKYIYAYFEDPDSTLHMKGSKSFKTKHIFRKIDRSTKRLAKKLKDTVLIVIADHGHIDTTPYIITQDYPDFAETLDGDTWLEGRFCSFKVKDEENFKKLFNKYFGKEFVLKTKQEIIDGQFFGTGKEHKLFRKELGDYFALATSDKVLRYSMPHHIFKSSHAGLTEDEMRIPLIIVSKGK